MNTNRAALTTETATIGTVVYKGNGKVAHVITSDVWEDAPVVGIRKVGAKSGTYQRIENLTVEVS